MAALRPEAGDRPTATLTLLGVVKPMRQDWEKFSLRRDSWIRRIECEPLYCLPEPAIARLEYPRFGHPPLLNVADAAAERDLLAFCRRYHAVGFGAGMPIVYPYLDPAPRRSFRADFPDHGFTEAQWAAVALIEKRSDTANLRLKGYAGWLATETPFLDAVRALEMRWRDLPDDQRPGLPLRRTAPAIVRAGEADSSPASGEIASFAADYDAFCDRWGLLGLAAWDLPEPQGPLFPSLLPAGAPALPEHGLHIFLPVHTPLANADDLLHEILRQQRQLSADLALDRTSAGLSHHEAYATILEVVHWERVITGRYGRGRRRLGFVGLVVEAVAKAVGLQVNQVQKWRKAVSACRRGKRSRIEALRVAAD